MADLYRLALVVEVLDGSEPSDIVACLERYHGDVISCEVLDASEGPEEPGDEVGAGAGARGAGMGA